MTTVNVGSVLMVNPGVYFQDAPRESVTIVSSTRITSAPYSKAWTVTLSAPISTSIDFSNTGTGFVLHTGTHGSLEQYVGIIGVNANKTVLTVASDDWPQPPRNAIFSVYKNILYTSTVQTGSTSSNIVLAAGAPDTIYAGTSVDITGFQTTKVTAYNSGTRTITVSPTLTSAPSAGVAITLSADPINGAGTISAPDIQRRYEWYRNGVKIPYADYRIYTTVPADVGQNITAKEITNYWDLSSVTSIKEANSSYQPTGTVPTGQITPGNFTYLGAFNAPSIPSGAITDFSGSSGGGGGRHIWFNELGASGAGSLLISGREAASAPYITEISIPAQNTWAVDGNPTNTNRSQFLVSSPYFFSVANGNMQNTQLPNGPDSNGLRPGSPFIHNGNIYQAWGSFYQGANTTATHFKRTGTAINAGTVSGPFAFASKSISLSPSYSTSPLWYVGHICKIPTTWQTRLGGKFISVQEQYSNPVPMGYGPNMFSFDPDQIGVTLPVPNTVLAAWNDLAPLEPFTGCGMHNMWVRGTSTAYGVFFPSGTSTVLTVNRVGTGKSQYGTPGRIGACATDASGTSTIIFPMGDKGWHASPYESRMMAFDAADLEAVKNGTKLASAVRPYAVWPFSVPGWITTGSSTNGVNGIAWDDTNKRMYIAETETARTNNNGFTPIIHVFQLTI